MSQSKNYKRKISTSNATLIQSKIQINNHESQGKVRVAKYDFKSKKTPTTKSYTNILIHVKDDLSPYTLKDDQDRLMENLWQFSKIYPSVRKQNQTVHRFTSEKGWVWPGETHCIIDANEVNPTNNPSNPSNNLNNNLINLTPLSNIKITNAYWKWRNNGQRFTYPIRYPNGYYGRTDCKSVVLMHEFKLDNFFAVSCFGISELCSNTQLAPDVMILIFEYTDSILSNTPMHIEDMKNIRNVLDLAGRGNRDITNMDMSNKDKSVEHARNIKYVNEDTRNVKDIRDDKNLNDKSNNKTINKTIVNNKTHTKIIVPIFLNITQGRALIYFRTYAELVRKHPAYIKLKRRLENGENLQIAEVDGPPIDDRNTVPFECVENGSIEVSKYVVQQWIKSRYSFGHGICLAVCLLDADEWVYSCV